MPSTIRLDWDRLLSSKRLADSDPAAKTSSSVEPLPWLIETRDESERDFDRVRFAAPVRRLADKTQVFPLEPNDSVRTRLTHSDEVSAMARSIGSHLAHVVLPARGQNVSVRTVPATLAAVGLAHDLGNPPFGHQGEQAMRRWFRAHEGMLFGTGALPTDAGAAEKEGFAEARTLTDAMKADFLKFEGNAQTLRLVARLQASTDGYGLNLTCGSLAALMKYVVASDRVRKDGPLSGRKPGYFCSETKIVDAVRAETGLPEGVRHPLTYLMEACDDIAYSAIDAEDSVKKGLVSVADLAAFLAATAKGDQAIKYVVERTREAHEAARTGRLTPGELNDVSMQKFRVFAMGALISGAIRTFEERYDDIMAGTFAGSLLEASEGARLIEALRRFDREHAYRHREVLAVELRGFNTIYELMTMLWRGIVEREAFSKLSSDRTSSFADFAYSCISDNYRKAFESDSTGPFATKMPIRYREMQLLADMVSGMTDTFAIKLHEKLSSFHVGPSRRNF